MVAAGRVAVDLPRSHRRRIKLPSRRPSMAARYSIRSSSQSSIKPSTARGRPSMRCPAKSSAACTTRKPESAVRPQRNARPHAADVSYAGVPGELGALGFGGPQLAYAAADANAACRIKAAPGHARKPRTRSHLLGAGSRRLGPHRQRRQCRVGDEPGSAASSPASMRGSATRARRARGGLSALRPPCRCPHEQRRHRQRPARRLCGRPSAPSMCAAARPGRSTASIPAAASSSPASPTRRSASFHGNVGQVFGEVGYGMAFGHVAVEPLAGLAYVHVRDGSFLESGGVAALSGVERE